MKTFNINLPKEVLFPNKHDKINFNALEGKIILAFMGFAKSGKDTIAKSFVENYGYQRIAFADNIKRELNKYLKEVICNDIHEYARKCDYEMSREMTNYMLNLDVSKIDFFTENLELKKILRPYIIWYGEKLRTINGKFCWINRAFEEDGKDIDKIVLSDVRRLAELDIFKNSNEFKKRQINSMAEAGLIIPDSLETNNYGTLLFEVNQFGLTDSDNLTIETIQYAHNNWLIDDIFWVDSRVPSDGNSRRIAMDAQIKKIVKRFGIEKPERVKHKQINIFNS